ncbi:hypothetical protein E1B28_011034 [Marasmius oreades]|uniref:Decapping nuclease n=1 Tax=Marasmius oreades TaxID=181124 RepID=A0A9P7URM6_9AGAR|nr:uncharacterized protein E1B28_011034 [Marasmius oreades]KAG7089344.1 hypothetical protein E1B28_011034 [Marasmius oreades]
MSKRPLEHENIDSESHGSAGRKKIRLNDGVGHPSLPSKPQVYESERNSQQPTGNLLSYPPRDQIQKAPPFQLPTPLISFSYDEDHVQEFTDSALRYYKPIPLESLGGRGPSGQGGIGRRDQGTRGGYGYGVDLNYGYERWIRRPEERGRLDPLLRAVEKVCFRGGDSEGHQEGKLRLKDISIVAWRGVMTKILTAPYEERDGWSMNVMLVNGTLYLEEHLNEEKLLDKNNVEDRQRRNMYYGYAFESFCTTEPSSSGSEGNSSNAKDEHSTSTSTSHKQDDKNPLWGGDVNTNVQWCSVVKTKLGDMRIIIGGEVDCVKGNYHPHTTDNFVELKTSMTIRKWNQGDELRFDKKLLKFYFQSFLLGVPVSCRMFTSSGFHQASDECFSRELTLLES